MRLCLLSLTVAAILATPACARQPAEAAAEQRAPDDGRLMLPEKVTDRVWYKRQPPRIWSAVIGNVGIIEQRDGVVVIDSGGSIADGRDIVAEVAKLTPKPIKAVAITHWHNDHPLGVPGILERYPRARIIATAETARMMVDIMGKNVGVGRNDPALDKARAESGAARMREYEASARDPKLSAEERGEFAIEAKYVGARLKRQMGNYVAVPTETFADRLLLEDPVAPVELSFIGAANTGGDLIAWLPRQRVLFTGDAVVAPSPYGFNANTRSWIAVLQKLKALDFAVLVPGHGAIQRDSVFLDAMIWSMDDVRAQVEKAIRSGKSAEQTWAAFDQTPHIEHFKAQTRWARRWLVGYWLEPIVDSAYREIKDGKVVEGS